MAPETTRKSMAWEGARSGIAMVMGAGGLVWEAGFQAQPRTLLVLLFASMILAPSARLADALVKRISGDSGEK